MNNFESLYRKIIPFCEENFITVPLGEEGDHTPHLNIFIGIPACDQRNFSDVISRLRKSYKGYKICTDFKFRITKERKIYNIEIYKKQDVLNKDTIMDYSIDTLMEIAIEIIENVVVLKSEKKITNE